MTDDNRPSTVTPVIEIGEAGYGRTSTRRGLVYDEFLPYLRGRQALRVFREMHDNSAIASAYAKICEAYIVQAPRKFEIGKRAVSPQAELYRSAIETMFEDMDTTFSGFLSDVSSFNWNGFAYHEMTYKIRRGPDAALPYMRSKFTDGFYGIQDIAARRQDTLSEWKWDDHGKVVGAFQTAPPEGRTNYLPIDGVTDGGAPVQCVHFKTKNAGGNPEGSSSYRGAVVDWRAVKRLQEFESIGVERDMAGEPVQEVPVEVWNDAIANTASVAARTIEKLRKFVERMRRGEYSGLVVPGKYKANGEMSGYDTRLMQSGGRRPVDQDMIIKRRESRMALSMLAEGILLGMQGSAGSGSSWSLASNKTHMLAMMVNSFLRQIADVINGVIIPRVMHANGWPIHEAPCFTFGDLEPDDMVAILPALNGAIGAGAVVNGPKIDRWIRNQLSIPLEDEVSPGMLQDRVGAYAEQQQQSLVTPPAPGNEDVADPAETEETELDPEDAEEAAEALERGLTPEEAASQAGVTPGQIKAAIARGQLPGARIGRSYRVMNTDLREYMRGSGRK